MKIKINGKVFNTEVKKTPEELEKGLADRAPLDKETAALLVLKNGKITMTKTNSKLKIIFANKEGKVVHVAEGMPNDPNLITSPEDSDMVIELADTEHEVKVGDQIETIADDGVQTAEQGAVLEKKEEESDTKTALPPSIQKYIDVYYTEDIESFVKDNTNYRVIMAGGDIITFSSDGRVLSTLENPEKLFDYLNVIDLPGGQSHQLDGYKLEGEELIRDNTQSVKGILHTLTDKYQEYRETQVGKNLWTYNVREEETEEHKEHEIKENAALTVIEEKVEELKELEKIEKMQEGGEMQILKDNGEVQMHLEGGERIFSIPQTKTLIRLAKEKDYMKLAKATVKFVTKQDTQENEYVETV